MLSIELGALHAAPELMLFALKRLLVVCVQEEHSTVNKSSKPCGFARHGIWIIINHRGVALKITGKTYVLAIKMRPLCFIWDMHCSIKVFIKITRSVICLLRPLCMWEIVLRCLGFNWLLTLKLTCYVSVLTTPWNVIHLEQRNFHKKATLPCFIAFTAIEKQSFLHKV